MKAEYINPFIESAQSVVNMLLGIEIKTGKAYLKNPPFIVNQTVIIIGVIGKIKGQVYFELTTDTTKKIASGMMRGMTITELDEISKSAVSEMVNMIMGNTSTIFAKKNIEVDITPPTLLIGDKIEISHKDSIIVVPLELEGLGTIAINVAVEEATSVA
jgi:chemotaxis protein CheX